MSTVTLKNYRCNNCLHTWQSNLMEPCPMCEQGRIIRKERAYRYKMQREDFRKRMFGEAVSDRERVCDIEEGGCGQPLMGHCAYDVDDITGQQMLVCDCGHETPIWDEDKLVRR